MSSNRIPTLDFSGERSLGAPMQADGPCSWVDPSSCERWERDRSMTRNETFDLDVFAAQVLGFPTDPSRVRDVRVSECEGGVLVSFRLLTESPKPTAEFLCTR